MAELGGSVTQNGMKEGLDESVFRNGHENDGHHRIGATAAASAADTAAGGGGEQERLLWTVDDSPDLRVWSG